MLRNARAPSSPSLFHTNKDVGTYYWVGPSLEVSRSNEVVSAARDFLGSMQSDTTTYVFSDRATAMDYARHIAEYDRANEANHSGSYRFFSPVITVKIKDVRLLKACEAPIMELNVRDPLAPLETYPCFGVSSNQIEILHEAYFENFTVALRELLLAQQQTAATVFVK